MSVVALFGDRSCLNLEKPAQVPGSEDERNKESLKCRRCYSVTLVLSTEIVFYARTAFPFPTVAPTPKPPRTKHKLVAEGRKLTFRCGKKIAAKQGKVEWVLRKRSYTFESTALYKWLPFDSLTSNLHHSDFHSWYKDGELLEFSHPGYITLKDDHISIVANAINEGTYTCIVRKKNKVLTTYSWKLRVRFWGFQATTSNNTDQKKKYIKPQHTDRLRPKWAPRSLCHCVILV